MDFDQKLAQTFRTGLGLDPHSEVESLEFSKSEHWDSIGHMKLIAALEEAFDIRMNVNDILNMSSYSVARQTVAKYLGRAL